MLGHLQPSFSKPTCAHSSCPSTENRASHQATQQGGSSPLLSDPPPKASSNAVLGLRSTCQLQMCFNQVTRVPLRKEPLTCSKCRNLFVLKTSRNYTNFSCRSVFRPRQACSFLKSSRSEMMHLILFSTRLFIFPALSSRSNLHSYTVNLHFLRTV